MTQAVIDIAKGTVASDEQVDVKLLNGTLVGQRLRITEHGEVVRFEGGVVMNMMMDPPTPDETAPVKPAPELAPQPESYTPPAKPRPSTAKRANAK